MAAQADGNGTPGRTAEVRSVAAMKSATDLNKLIQRLKASRSRLENQWQLNLNFFNGKQYCYFSPKLNKIVSLPTQEGEKPRYRIRVTSNQINKNSFKLLAKATKTKPQFSATPGSADPAAVKAAQVAESLAEHWWFHLGMARKYADAWLLAIIMGSGFWFLGYDKFYGEPETYIMEPDPETGAPSDKPMVNDSLKQLFKQQLEQAGIPLDAYEKTVYPGELCVDVMDPRNVYLDDTAVDSESARWCVVRRHMDPMDIKNRWGKSFDADSVPDSGEPLSIFTIENQTEKSTKAVYALYSVPTPDNPKGRIVYWADDQILEDGPYLKCYGGRLPLVRFGSLRHPLNPYGSSVVEGAIDDQKEYNRVLSKVIEFLMLTLTPRVWAPLGSVRGRVTNEPGQIIEYVPQGGMKPETEKLGSIPPYVFEHVQGIRARLDEDFFVNEIAQGTPPPNVEAGVAIDLLQEAASDTFAPMVLDNEHSLSRALMIMLELAREYYTEPRMIRITGLNGSSRLQSFKMADMTPGIRIAVETGSSMPRTRASRTMMVLELMKQGVIPPEKAWKYLDMPDLKSLTVKMQGDEDQALREHDKILNGEPLNKGAFQQAMSAVQQGVNPQTQQPFQSADEVQQFLEQAALSPGVVDNHAVHLDVHGTYMKSVEWEQLPDQVKQDYETHYGIHMQSFQAQNPLPENVRTSMQIKSTLGPTAAAQILTQAGVQGITPETMMEPPLETVVLDTIDKPDDPNAMAAPQKHAAELAQQEAQMAQQQLQAVDAQETAHQQRQHAQQSHDQKMAHAEEAHQAKLKALSEKPKPTKAA